MSAAEIYAECLSHLKHGHPMYIPEPIINANTIGHNFNQIDGVAIGDVGIIRSEGDFDFLFDVCDNSSRSVRALGVQAEADASTSRSVDTQARGASSCTVPEEHEPVIVDEIRINNNFLSSENPFLAYGREATTDAGAGASVTFSEITAHLVRLEAGARWQFACSSHKGAVAVAPQGAISIDAPQEQRFLNCLDKIQTWFKYAENTRERTLENNSLTLVTGVVKCSTWSVAALLNSSSSSNGGQLSLSLTTAVSADASMSHSWSECQPAMCRSGPAEPRSGTRDQCLFIRGYRIMKQNFAERRIKKKVGVTNLRTDKLAYHKINEPRSRGFLGSVLDLPSKSGTAQGDSNSQVSMSADDEYVVEKLSEAQKLYHPSDVINRYLLENIPEAKFAVTHDKDWWQLLKDTDCAIPSDSELLYRLKCTYRFVLKTGIIYLEKLGITVVNTDLKRLLAPVDAGFDRSGPVAKCFDGTREDLIAKIKQWTDDGDPDRPICWLSGPAGYGKSSISQTIGEYCDSKKLMAASFFFAQDAQHRSTIAHLVSTLAYQLSNSVPETRPFLQQALGSDLSILSRPLSHQFQKLMVEPILAVGDSTFTPKRPAIIVIDALDECSDKELMTESLEFITNACLENRDFPFRFFLTSRVEKHLQKKLKAFVSRLVIYPLDLRNFDASDDIRKFFRSQFFGVHEENQKLTRGIPRSWPSNSDMEALVEMAGCSFRRASEFIDIANDKADKPYQNLEVVLGLKGQPRRQRPSFGLSRITKWPLHSSSPQNSGESSHAGLPPSICSISPILPDPTSIAAEGGRHTLEGLIENLILPPVREPEEYKDAFLTTHTAFTTTNEVFESLVRRFCDTEAIHPQHRTHIRIGVIDVMKYWVTSPYFKLDINVLARVMEFALSIQSSESMKNLTQELHLAAAERLISPSIPHTIISLEPAKPTGPRDLAIALLILEGDKYARILPADYISYFQQQPGENTVRDVLETKCKIICWVQQAILRCDELGERSELLKFFVSTAEESRNLRNFLSMSAIVTAMRSTTITQLKLTFNRLPKKYMKNIEEMEAFPNPHDNRSAYVTALKGSESLPCVPVLDIHIADMRTAFFRACEPADVGDISTINFGRWMEFHKCVKDVFRHKSPDASQYRQQTAEVLAYLEGQLRGISIGSTTDQHLEERSSKLKQQEERLRKIDLIRAGFVR